MRRSVAIATVSQILLLLLSPLLTATVEGLAEPLRLNCTGPGDLTVPGGTDRLVLTAEGANRCRLTVSGDAAAGRWYVTLTVAADGADGDLVLREDVLLGHVAAAPVAWSGPDQLASDALSRMLTRAAGFILNVTLRRGRLSVAAWRVGPADCPPVADGWASPLGSGCLLVSPFTTGLSFAQAQVACARVGANLYTTVASDATAWALGYLFFNNYLHAGVGYWIGGRLVQGDWVYINGSRLTNGNLPPYKYDCSQSSTTCQCAVYREAQFYGTTCSDLRPFVCSAPPGGTFEVYPTEGTPCQDCRAATAATAASNQSSEDFEHQFYYYVLGFCAFVMAFITAAVIACFVDSVRRWQLDAGLAAMRPPAYGSQQPLHRMMTQQFESEPPVYENFLLEIESPTNQVPAGIASPTNQVPAGIALPTNQESAIA